MYNNQLAVAIKTAGKVLKEQKDKVFLPFGSEYSIYIKNLNTVRAAVRIQLDGVDVTDGQDLIVQANDSIDIERFLKRGNLTEGNRFKFIERTERVEAHRGVGVEDGLVRVEFQFEKVAPKTIEHDIHHYNHYYHHDCYPWYNPYPQYKPYPYFWCNTSLSGGGGATTSNLTSSNTIGNNDQFANYSANVGSSNMMRGLLPQSINTATANINTVTAANSVQSDAGITVPGSISNQQFTMVSSFPLDETKHVIILKLLGETSTGAVTVPITVKYKQKCVTCGTRNRGANKFCRECGTALEIV